MIKKTLTILIFAVGYSNAFSQAGSFLAIPLDAKSVAMGNTYIARENNNSFFTNIAASSLSNKKLELNINNRPWLNESSSNYNLFSLSGYYSIDTKSSLAVGFKKYSIPSYSITDDNGNSDGTYTPFEQTFGIGYAYNLSDKTALSISIQYLQSELGEDYNASTVFFDLGYKSSYKNLDYGFMIRNIGPELKFDEQSNSLPLSIGGGINYPIELQEKHKLTTSLDISRLSIDSESGIHSGIGLQYAYNNLLSLRTGYSYYDETIGISALSIGGGANYKGFDVDFSWLLTNNLLQNNYAISCSWNLFKK